MAATRNQGPANMGSQMNYDPRTGEPLYDPGSVADESQPSARESRKRSKQSHPNKAIDKSFEQWNRFENFLKFAQKKEVRDRLKEFHAPDVANYIDADTVDKITAERRPKALAGTIKKGQSKQKDEKQLKKEAQEEHRQRIQKMKELYGMFMRMEAEENNEAPDEEQHDQQQDISAAAHHIQSRTVVQQNRAKIHLLPEVPITPQSKVHKQQTSPEKSIGSSSKDIENVRLPDIPQDQLGRSLQSQNAPSDMAPSAANQNFMKTSKYTNIKDKTAADIGEEHIEIDIHDRGYSSFKRRDGQEERHQGSGEKREKSAIDGSSLVDGDVDGLLKWAKDLPDVSGPDGQFAASGSSFFKKGIL